MQVCWSFCQCIDRRFGLNLDRLVSKCLDSYDRYSSRQFVDKELIFLSAHSVVECFNLLCYSVLQYLL